MRQKQRTPPPDSPWRSRIVDHGSVKATSLTANPSNWRIHPTGQQRTIAALLDKVGWVQDVVVNKRTGHVVDGHLRVTIAVARDETVPVVYVDLSEAEEKLVLASMDPITGMAVTDDGQLKALLDGLEAEGALADLLAELEEGLAPVSTVATPEDNTRDLGDRERLVKAVLYVNEIDVVERALAKTNEVDRGSAFLKVCRAYLQE